MRFAVAIWVCLCNDINRQMLLTRMDTKHTTIKLQFVSKLPHFAKPTTQVQQHETLLNHTATTYQSSGQCLYYGLLSPPIVVPLHAVSCTTPMHIPGQITDLDYWYVSTYPSTCTSCHGSIIYRTCRSHLYTLVVNIPCNISWNSR